MQVFNWKKWIRLNAGIFLIGWLIQVGIPWLFSGEQAREMRRFIEEKDIDAGALFYTDSPEAGAVNYFMQKNKPHRKKTEAGKN